MLGFTTKHFSQLLNGENFTISSFSENVLHLSLEGEKVEKNLSKADLQTDILITRQVCNLLLTDRYQILIPDS